MTLHISQVGSGVGLMAVVLLSACGDGSSDASDGGVMDGSAMDGSTLDGGGSDGSTLDSGGGSDGSTLDSGGGSDGSALDSGGDADASQDGAQADADTDASPEDAATDASDADAAVADADTDANEEDAGPEAPTFTEIYDNIIAMKCMPCHTSNASGNLSMSDRDTAYANLVDVLAMGFSCNDGERTRVIPEMPEESLIIQKLRGGADLPCGSQMPQGRTPLPDEQIADIASWIEVGAPDD